MIALFQRMHGSTLQGLCCGLTLELQEAERMQLEESIFGGATQGDKAKVQLEVGAARFIVEEFVPARRLTRVSGQMSTGSPPVWTWSCLSGMPDLLSVAP